MLVHKGGQIKNWSGEYRDIIPTKLQFASLKLLASFHDYKFSKSKSAKGDNSKKIK